MPSSRSPTARLSIERIYALLGKQRIVEGMVHGQAMPRHDLVETLVQRQHAAELEGVLAALSAEEIGSILSEVSLADAQLLWALVPEERRNSVLWELSEDRREQLAASREPPAD